MITSEGGILAKPHRALRCDAATSYCMSPPQRSRSYTPIEPQAVVHNTTNFATAVEVVDGTCGTVCGGVEWKVKLSRARHCQVLALPLTHSPEGGSQWCQITPGVPTPRLPGVCGCTCDWSVTACCVLTGAMWVAVALQWQDQPGMLPISPRTGPRGSRQ